MLVLITEANIYVLTDVRYMRFTSVQRNKFIIIVNAAS